MGVIASDRPRVLLLIDQRGWAFETIARAIERCLGDRFAFEIAATAEKPPIDESSFDIIHTFFDRERYHVPFVHGRARIVKSVYSEYWHFEGMTASELYDQFHHDAHAILVPNFKLLMLLRDLPVPVHIFPEGVDASLFAPRIRDRTEGFRVGWAGNPDRYIKRFEWLKKAAKGIGELFLATGDRTVDAMVDFYNDIDVIACSSQAEGSPRPILEGMACGAFPVSFDVGVVPEVVTPFVNGLIVEEESVEGLRSALTWCRDHLDHVRRARPLNVERMRATRRWESVVQSLAAIYHSLL